MIPSSHSLAVEYKADDSFSIRSLSAADRCSFAALSAAAVDVDLDLDLPLTESMTDASWSGPMTQIFALGHIQRKRGEYCSSVLFYRLTLPLCHLPPVTLSNGSRGQKRAEIETHRSSAHAIIPSPIRSSGDNRKLGHLGPRHRSHHLGAIFCYTPSFGLFTHHVP
jgi:hypothetical protein